MINPEWDAIFQRREWQMQPAVGVVLLFAFGLYHSDRKNIKVLEIGCGTGANLWYLACEGYPVYGIDGSPTAIEKTRAYLDKVSPQWKGELRVGGIDNLPYEDNMFDVVIDINAATCNPFEEMIKIYGEVSRVLKPGGLFHSQIFCEGTDPVCIQPGTEATFVTQDQLTELYKDFVGRMTERRIRPYFNHQDAVREWMVTAKKPGQWA